MNYLEFVDEFRVGNFFDELEPEEYKAKKRELMEKVANAEDELVKTFNEDQHESYEKLDDAIFNYVELLEKDAFFCGFELAKRVYSGK